MPHRWGPETPAHTGRGPGSLILRGWGWGTPAHAGRNPNTPTPWGQGPGTPAHAGRGLGTPVPWAQLTPRTPALGTPREKLLGSQTCSTTTHPRGAAPLLHRPRPQWDQQNPHQERPEHGDTHTHTRHILLSQGSIGSSSEPPLPLITCDKESRSVIRKTNLVTAN